MSSDVEPPDEANDKTERKIKPSHTSIYYTISMVVLCMAAEYLSGTQLPKQRLGHILTSQPSELKFSANHAKQTLEELTAFGPRVTGSRITEIDVPSYLKKKLLQLSRDMPDGVHLEVSDQHPSSSFYLDFLGGMTNVMSIECSDNLQFLYRCPSTRDYHSLFLSVGVSECDECHRQAPLAHGSVGH